jgi:23S rRNA (cytidine1920-2'-O)/16S rRNA (cytidine1409-2'-O)-methyltransferase
VPERLDVMVFDSGRARSRSQAAELIRAGRVSVNGRTITKPGHRVSGAEVIAVQPDPWVSRAAHKLLGALDQSGLEVPPRVLDAGASTGGFTQVLLGRGAQVVYAVDVGHDQLAPTIRADARVRVREGLNLRELTLADLDDQPVDLVVADVSFISLRLLLRPLFSVLSVEGVALLMIKPQFEVGRGGLGAGGVVRSDQDRTQAIEAVIAEAAELGWQPKWRGDSVLPGPAGNLEHFVCLKPATAG